MTPYAVLLVKPTDSDEVIRKTYWEQAKLHHPDKPLSNPTLWSLFTNAYTAIKTKDARDALARKQDLLARLCATCDGSGVGGTRMFKGRIRVCDVCKGEGRT